MANVLKRLIISGAMLIFAANPASANVNKSAVLSFEFESETDCLAAAQELSPILKRQLSVENLISFCHQNYAVFTYDSDADFSLDAYHSKDALFGDEDEFVTLVTEMRSSEYLSYSNGELITRTVTYTVNVPATEHATVKFESETECRQSLDYISSSISTGSNFGYDNLGARNILHKDCISLGDGRFGFFVVYFEPVP